MDPENLPRKSKKNACIYCGNLFSKLVLHLERKHLDEKDVKRFSTLPKGCMERKKMIEILRKEGNFRYSKKENIIIGCRREQKNREGKVSYMVCYNCKGYFSSTSLRHHVRKCAQKTDNKKNISVLSRKIWWDVHPSACSVLKNDILPVLRIDEITNSIRYDSFLISYGNRMVVKYRSPHHYTMIRARLRSLGRLLLEMRIRQPDNIENFDDILEPQYYDDIISSINSIAQLDPKSGHYKAPSTAFNLGILLKYCINMKISQCIKIGDDVRKKKAKDLLKLFTEDVSTSVNKTVAENQSEMRRNKVVNLPINDDIQRLNSYLTRKRRKYYKELLTDGFSYLKWKELASLVLISIQLFNRRRAGEIERFLINDFKNYKTVSENTDPEIFNSLSNESQKAAAQYGRAVIRGKLGKTVPVLIHKELIVMGNYVIDHKLDAKVEPDNPYVFGVPGGTYKYLRACPILKKYSESCGAKNAKALRGTELRKHIATQSVLYDLKETEVQDLANFLGHELSIHKNYYRLPIITRDIAQMSKLLEKAQGCHITNNDEMNGKINIAVERFPKSDTVGFDNANIIYVNQNDPSSVIHQVAEDDDSLHYNECGNSDQKGNKKGQLIKDCHIPLTPIEKRVKRRLFPVEDSQPCSSRALPLRTGFSQISRTFSNKTSSSEDSASENDNNYRPVSNSDSDEQDSEVTKGQIKRSTWSTPEKKLARRLMSESKKLPTLNRCQKFIAQNSILRQRSAAQLKAWINNSVQKAKVEGSSSPRKKIRAKITWVTPERHAINKFFKDHIRKQRLPSYNECRKATEEYPVLQRRSLAIIKAKVNNEIKRRSALT